MPPTRRRLLFSTLASALLFFTSAVRAQPTAGKKRPLRTYPIDPITLAAWLDTLMPRDAHSPSASDLNVHTALLERTDSNRQLAMFLSQGLAWIDQEASRRSGKSFVNTTQRYRDTIAALAEASGSGSAQKRFFAFTLNTCFELYYSDPRSWIALNFSGPPQPAGYMDFASAPDKVTYGE